MVNEEVDYYNKINQYILEVLEEIEADCYDSINNCNLVIGVKLSNYWNYNVILHKMVIQVNVSVCYFHNVIFYNSVRSQIHF